MFLWFILLVAPAVVRSIQAVVSGHSHEKAESSGSDPGWPSGGVSAGMQEGFRGCMV